MSADPILTPVEEEAGAARWNSRSLLTWSRTAQGRRATGLLAGLTVVALFGAWWIASGREVTDNATVEGAIYPVSPRVSGAVGRVHVVDNQRVEAGDVLVEIESLPYEVRLDRARADLAEAEALARAAMTDVPILSTITRSELQSAEAAAEDAQAGVVLWQRQVEATRARLASAQAELRLAEAEHERAARDLDRFRPLLDRDEISRQEFDTAEVDEKARRAARDSAVATITVARSEIEIAEKRLTQAMAAQRASRAGVAAASMGPQRVSVIEARAASAAAGVQQARAALRQAELNLGYTRVVAPAAGVVSRKNVEVGQYLRSGQSILAIVDPLEVWVVARFKETQLRNMRPGQAVRLRVDAYPGSLRGRVESIAAATTSRFSLLPAENATGNFVKVVQRVPVKIVIEGETSPDRPLRPGMSVVAKVTTR